jgi:HSP20 family protein
MAIVRWDPFDSLFAPGDVSQVFRHMLGQTGEEEPLRGGTWAPAVDVYEGDGGLVVEAELPGVDPADIDVSIDEGVLTIKGQRRHSKEVREDNYYRVERAWGTFQRSMRLATGVDPDKVSASYENGVLKVTVPKAEEAAQKSVPIEVETKKSE